MDSFEKSFRKESSTLPCAGGEDCPYEYDKESDRDIEGMPFVTGDPRSCPQHGHVCPKFMEDFGLSVEDLNIRATIHCGSLLDHIIAEGKASAESPEVKALRNRYEEVRRQYPPDEFPQYYSGFTEWGKQERSWRSFPPWKKTGVVFAAVFLAIAIVDLVLFCGIGTRMRDPCGILLIVFTLPIFNFTRSFGSGYSWYFGTVVVGAIFYFGVGAAISWLFSSRESRSRPDDK
ncbi:MAG: hypothetical protein AB1646_20285 [Thermodesulfobacteriota bacterium]